MNKTQKSILSLAILCIIGVPVMALALTGDVPPTAGSISSLSDLIKNIEIAIWMIFAAIAVIMFVVAGILFLTAQGAPEKVQAARSAFMWGVVGVIVGIIAYSIIAIVSSVIG